MNLYIVTLPQHLKGFTVNGVNGHVVLAESEEDALAMVKSFYTSNTSIWDSADVEELTFLDSAQVPDYTGWALGVQINTAAGVGYANVEAEGTEGVSLYGFSLIDGGGSYTIGNTLSVAGGTGTAFKIEVTAVNSGTITDFDVIDVGDYSVAPTSPNTLTGGAGEGAIAEFNVLEGVSVHSLANAVVGELNSLSGIANAAYNPITGVLTVAGSGDSFGTHGIDVYFVSPGEDAQRFDEGVGTIVDSDTVANAALTAVLLGPEDYKPPVLLEAFGKN